MAKPTKEQAKAMKDAHRKRYTHTAWANCCGYSYKVRLRLVGYWWCPDLGNLPFNKYDGIACMFFSINIKHIKPILRSKS